VVPIHDGADDYEARIGSEDSAGAAMVGSGAVIVLAGVAVYCTHGEQVTAAGNASAPLTTTEPTVPAIEKAVPSITGPAPLYAGEAPNSNPQAPTP
jgi:hypothetical protein